MSKISCHLRLGEVPLHLYQIIAGFILLWKQGVIDLQIEKLKFNNPVQLPYNMLEVIVNHDVRVLYDVNDGYDNLLSHEEEYAGWYDKLLENYRFCFKRSFSQSYNSYLKQGIKIQPLGLNYMVSIPGNTAHMPMPQDPFHEKTKKLVRMLPFSEFYNGLYNINSFEDIPRPQMSPRILFMARLWDANASDKWNISSEKREERLYINEFRAECIRLCRKEFGERFFGGVSKSDFSCKNYPDIVIEAKDVTKRNVYLSKVKESSICIATMGLHKSTGWKLAEYVAASKAIVTEELHYEVPGNFKEHDNFLVFHTPDECIDQIDKLVNNDDLRFNIMLNNYRYYHQYVRADRLILNSLFTVLHYDNVKDAV
jgi:hypothetical protein